MHFTYMWSKFENGLSFIQQMFYYEALELVRTEARRLQPHSKSAVSVTAEKLAPQN